MPPSPPVFVRHLLFMSGGQVPRVYGVQAFAPQGTQLRGLARMSPHPVAEFLVVVLNVFMAIPPHGFCYKSAVCTEWARTSLAAGRPGRLRMLPVPLDQHGGAQFLPCQAVVEGECGLRAAPASVGERTPRTGSCCVRAVEHLGVGLRLERPGGSWGRNTLSKAFGGDGTAFLPPETSSRVWAAAARVALAGAGAWCAGS